MTWAQRLKRVFGIDVETCRVCGGTAKVMACIEDPVVTRKILDHLKRKADTKTPGPSLPVDCLLTRVEKDVYPSYTLFAERGPFALVRPDSPVHLMIDPLPARYHLL